MICDERHPNGRWTCNRPTGHPGEHCRLKMLSDGCHENYWWPSECDCQNPEPDSGTAGISNECPIHNYNPYPPEIGGES